MHVVEMGSTGSVCRGRMPLFKRRKLGASHIIRDRSVTMAVNVLHAAEALRDGINLL